MSKKFSALFLMFFMFVSSASASYYDGSQGGTSAEDAYLITSVSDLKLLRDRVNSGVEETGKYYKLTKNLDLTSEKNWTPIGLKDENADLNDVSLSPSQKFYGHFDGDGHTILVSIDKYLKNSTRANVNAGLFGVCGDGSSGIGASIENLTVSGIVIARASTDIDGDGGAVAGGIVIKFTSDNNSSLIKNCKFDGTVAAYHDGSNGKAFAGGIVGTLQNGGASIESCDVPYGSFVIANAENNTRDYTSYAGGITGYEGIISNCTARARIYGDKCLGGITGNSDLAESIDDRVTNCKYSGAEYGIGEVIVNTNGDTDPSDSGCTFDPIAIDILTEKLPSARVGQNYSVTFDATEVRGVKWSISGGELPEDLTLTSNGVLSGIPESADVYEFTVKVSMSDFNLSDTVKYKLEVKSGSSSGGGSGGGGGCNSSFSIWGISALLIIFALKFKYKNIL